MPGRTGRRANAKNTCCCGLIALYSKNTYIDPHGVTIHTREECFPAKKALDLVEEVFKEKTPPITRLLGGK